MPTVDWTNQAVAWKAEEIDIGHAISDKNWVFMSCSTETLDVYAISVTVLDRTSETRFASVGDARH